MHVTALGFARRWFRALVLRYREHQSGLDTTLMFANLDESHLEPVYSVSLVPPLPKNTQVTAREYVEMYQYPITGLERAMLKKGTWL